MFPSASLTGGGTNFFAYRPGYVRSAVTSASYVAALNIQGSGILTSIYQHVTGVATTGSVRVTIDGVVVFDDMAFSATGGSNGVQTSAPSVVFFSNFSRSLLVEHAADNSQDSRIFITYLTL